MKNNLWVLITLAAGLLGFLAGYSISSSTGVEPGFFEAVETGSYGGGGGEETTEGISAEDQEYYRELTTE
ncbi:MAG: hypothetical protein BMS9Abin36_1790 [Gammaproteobacteria bacterium]|nr:MAG: hypothetical protein BMS9Abin36_1790 [Gammaproteobacteria bacterium]